MGLDVEQENDVIGTDLEEESEAEEPISNAPSLAKIEAISEIDLASDAACPPATPVTSSNRKSSISRLNFTF